MGRMPLQTQTRWRWACATAPGVQAEERAKELQDEQRLQREQDQLRQATDAEKVRGRVSAGARFKNLEYMGRGSSTEVARIRLGQHFVVNIAG